MTGKTWKHLLSVVFQAAQFVPSCLASWKSMRNLREKQKMFKRRADELNWNVDPCWSLINIGPISTKFLYVSRRGECIPSQSCEGPSKGLQVILREVMCSGCFPVFWTTFRLQAWLRQGVFLPKYDSQREKLKTFKRSQRTWKNMKEHERTK